MRIAILLLAAALCAGGADAQRRAAPEKQNTATRRAPEIGKPAVVLDESLAVLRAKASLFADSIQRMRVGRKVVILGVAESDGVRFFRVSVPPARTGWVQAEAVFGNFRPDDEIRLAQLIRASTGFEQIELVVQFRSLYPKSRLMPSILLLFGDLLEEAAGKLSKDAGSRLKRSEMAASGAPMHSYFLNFVGLDRYRKLGIRFLFEAGSRTYHYNGESWQELVVKFAGSPESAEARKRLDSLKAKMSGVAAG